MENLVVKGRTAQLLVALILMCGCATELPSGPEISITESPPQAIQSRIEYGFGPSLHWEVLLLKSYPEPLWLLGAEIEAVDNNGEPADLDLVDLVNVAWTYPDDHNKYFFPEHSCSSQIFRLSKELPKVSFPPGYGIPLWSNEPIAASVRWRNRSLYQKNTEVRLKLKLHFVRQRVQEKKMTALAVGELFAAAPLDSRVHYGQPPGSEPTELKLPKGHPREDGVGLLVDAHGTKYSEQWLAPKGESITEFLLTPQQPGLPNSRAVQMTAYAYPSVRKIELTGQDGALVLEEPFVAEEGFEFKDAQTVLRVYQNSRNGDSRTLAYLLGYFPVESFQDFPEMRQ